MTWLDSGGQWHSRPSGLCGGEGSKPIVLIMQWCMWASDSVAACIQSEHKTLDTMLVKLKHVKTQTQVKSELTNHIMITIYKIHINSCMTYVDTSTSCLKNSLVQPLVYCIYQLQSGSFLRRCTSNEFLHQVRYLVFSSCQW